MDIIQGKPNVCYERSGPQRASLTWKGGRWGHCDVGMMTKEQPPDLDILVGGDSEQEIIYTRKNLC